MQELQLSEFLRENQQGVCRGGLNYRPETPPPIQLILGLRYLREPTHYFLLAV